MKAQQPIIKIICAAVITMIMKGAHAGGFSLYMEGAGRNIGNYAAGAAAEAADASTGWYNPAGLVLLDCPQVVFSGIGLLLDTKISGTTRFETPSTTAPFSPYTESFANTNPSKDAIVPAFHLAVPLAPNITFGLSLVSPYGLSTDYSVYHPLRYAATYTNLTTMDLSPELGARVTENISVGAGLDLEYSRVKFNSVAGVPTLSQRLRQSPNFLDSISFNKVHSFSVGFHAGVLLMFNHEHTRIGLNYQSPVEHRFHGFSRFTGRLATPGLNLMSPLSILTTNPQAVYRSDNAFSNYIKLPEIVSLGVYHDVNDCFALLGTVLYTGWKSIRTIELNNVAAFAQVNFTSTEFFRNAWRFSLGANYRLNERLMLRAGGGYDQTPTRDAFRTPRLPDADRWALAIGVNYIIMPGLSLDAGYTHLFAKRSILNKTIFLSTNAFSFNAKTKAHADLIGLQLNWAFDRPAVVAIAPMK